MHKSKKQGFHVVWLAPSVYRSRGLEITKDTQVTLEPIPETMTLDLKKIKTRKDPKRGGSSTGGRAQSADGPGNMDEAGKACTPDMAQ